VKPSIAISWCGLPAYGARSIREAVNYFGSDIVVVATRPAVPVEGIEELAGVKISWLEPDQKIRWMELGLECPNFFLQSGWNIPAFNHFGDEVRANGGKVGLMADMPWFATNRQRIGTSIFRWRHRTKFCGILVPGKGGKQYARQLGFPEKQIHIGLYSAIPELFTSASQPSARSKRFTFVGQYIHRKGIDLLLESYQKLRDSSPDWTLALYGSGPIKPIEGPGVSVNSFLQAEAVAEVMQQSTVVVVPSRIDHWGVVVHEAALAGCVLIVSDTTGSRLDFCNERNSIIVKAGDSNSLYRAMHEVSTWSPHRLKTAEAESRQIGMTIGPRLFPQAIEQMVHS
jgi:Glycosyl transferases group 1